MFFFYSTLTEKYWKLPITWFHQFQIHSPKSRNDGPNSKDGPIILNICRYRYWNQRSTYSFIHNFAPVWLLINIFYAKTWTSRASGRKAQRLNCNYLKNWQGIYSFLLGLIMSKTPQRLCIELLIKIWNYKPFDFSDIIKSRRKEYLPSQ